jgi:putative ABC transport system substrate-binding protein
MDRIRTLAKELVALRPDAILSQTTPVTDALARETRTIPIVFVTVSDPIASGFATSLARPGGNVTGFALFEPSMGGKWVELLKKIAPRTVRVALLFNPATAVPPKIYMPSIQAAALSLAIEARASPVHTKDEIEGVIAAQARDPGGGLIVLPDIFTTGNRELISGLVARYGVPTIHNATSFPESGGLIAFGTHFAEQFREAAAYIDRILKGEKPADLPVQHPTKFKLVINIKTAKALSLDIPPTLLALADEVIE